MFIRDDTDRMKDFKRPVLPMDVLLHTVTGVFGVRAIMYHGCDLVSM